MNEELETPRGVSRVLSRNRNVAAKESKQCIFCGIARQELQSYSVFQDEISIAFLDKRPVFLGHCLLIPVEHYETLLDLPSSLVGQFFSNAKLLAEAIQKGMNADGVFIAINNKVSQGVPHLHVHIVPRRVKDGLKGFFWPRQAYASEKAALEVQEKLRTAIRDLQQVKSC